MSRHIEQARLEREAHLDRERTIRIGEPVLLVQPGSMAEHVALSRIDELRDEEREGVARGHPDAAPFTGLQGETFYRRGASPSTRASRRVAAKRYWSRTR